MTAKPRIVAVAAAGLFAVIAGAAAWANAGGPAAGDIPTARVQRGRVQVTVHATGELRATRSQLLSVPPVGGTLTIVQLAPSGSAVKAGDIVVEFDPSEQEFALEQANFDLQLAEQEIIKAEAEAAAQAADDEVSLLRAQFEVRRGELDAATNELVGAILAEQHRLLLQEARQRLAQLEVDVKSRRQGAVASAAVLRERRMKAQVAVDVARRNIENLQVRAPFDGFVTLRMNMMAFGGIVFSGAVMPEYRVGDTANSGQPVADLIDTSRVEVAAKLPEYDRANVASGQKVLVSVDALPQARLEGAVRSVSGVASRSMFEGGTRRFDIVFEVTGDTSRIRPGVSAALAIEGPAFDDALHIPRSSVFEIGGQPSVFVRTAEGFDAKEVRVRAFTDTVAVVEGLAPDAEVALVNPNTAGGRRSSSGSPRQAL
jgi:HlyD family secretion protein